MRRRRIARLPGPAHADLLVSFTEVADACRRNLDTLAGDLRRLDRPVRIAFEPEPG